MSLSDFEDNDVFTFETCITVNEKLINVAPFYFGKKGSQFSVHSVL